jgi:hypothetical protein
VSYAGLGDVELVLTDSSIGAAVLAAFREAGARIEVAPIRRQPHRRPAG